MPQFLPDGRHFLYYVEGTPDARGIYVGSLDESEARRLLDADTAAVYVSSGHLLFLRQQTLFAQAFDSDRLVLSGHPFPVDEKIAFNPAGAVAAVSASSTGVLVYRRGSPVGRRQFAWFDRSGNEVSRVGEPDSTGPLDPALSPDERHVAVYRILDGVPDIWLLDASRGVFSRFTFGRGQRGHIRPIWSPDGSHLVFNWTPKGVTDLFRKSVAGGREDLILETDQPKAATDWSSDGRFLLYRSSDPETRWDIWALPMDGKPDPVQVARTNYDDRDGQFSPDARWVAYQSNESGRFEIYVQPFPRPGPKSTISKDGGAQVRWRRDGKELFYVAPDERLMAVPMRLAPDGNSIDVGTPLPLFATHIGGAVRGVDRQQYMVSSDGQRFLMNTVIEEPTSPIIVLLNWKAR